MAFYTFNPNFENKAIAYRDHSLFLVTVTFLISILSVEDLKLFVEFPGFYIWLHFIVADDLWLSKEVKELERCMVFWMEEGEDRKYGFDMTFKRMGERLYEHLVKEAEKEIDLRGFKSTLR